MIISCFIKRIIERNIFIFEFNRNLGLILISIFRYDFEGASCSLKEVSLGISFNHHPKTYLDDHFKHTKSLLA